MTQRDDTKSTKPERSHIWPDQIRSTGCLLQLTDDSPGLAGEAGPGACLRAGDRPGGAVGSPAGVAVSAPPVQRRLHQRPDSQRVPEQGLTRAGKDIGHSKLPTQILICLLLAYVA